MHHSILTSLSIAFLFTLSGCGGAVDVVGTNESGDPAPRAKNQIGEVVRTPFISVSGAVHAADGAPLGDVNVCLQAGPLLAMDIGECALSGADGSWTLHEIPMNERLTIGFEKEGYVSVIRPIETASTDLEFPADEGRLIPQSNPPMFAGAPLSTQTGAIEFFVDSDAIDAKISANLFSFETGPRSPVYMGSDGSPVSQAVSGTFGGFVNLPAGIYFLTFRSESASCTPKGGLNGYPTFTNEVPDEATIAVPVTEGRVTTAVGVDCTGTVPVAGR